MLYFVSSFLLIFIYVVKCLTGKMKLADSGSLKDRGTFMLRSLFWKSPCSQTDLCAEMDEGHLGWVCGLRVGGLLCQHAHLHEHLSIQRHILYVDTLTR